MRLLNTNLLLTATLSAGGTSFNYPLSNLLSPFLKEKFQQMITYPMLVYSGDPVIYEGEVAFEVSDETSALTLAWTTDQSIDTFLCGYSNAKYIELRLYDSDSTLLYSSQFSNEKMGVVFPVVTGVRSAKVLMAADGDAPLMTVYLGGLGIGLSYATPDPINDWEVGLVDNSFGEQTLDGQVLGQYIEPLRVEIYNLLTNSFTVMKEIQAIAKSAGKYAPIWVAPFEYWMDKVQPMYALIEMSTPKKTDNEYMFSLTFTEAR